jgi:hypothetical protein
VTEEKSLEAKKPWQSKTVWAGVITALAAFSPQVQQWISENPNGFSWALTGLFTILRFVTKDKIAIK